VHEAIAEEAVAGVAAGHVSRIVQAGYRLGDKVLRFAKVAVQPAQGIPSRPLTEKDEDADAGDEPLETGA
jgi:hypothetical protein